MGQGEKFVFWRSYAKEIIKYYKVIKTEANRAKAERTKAHRNVWEGLGIGECTHKRFPPVPVAKCCVDGVSFEVMWPFQWLEAVDNALDYIQIRYGPKTMEAIKLCLIDGGNTADAAARYGMPYSRLNTYCQEFRLVVVGFAGDMGLLFCPPSFRAC